MTEPQEDHPHVIAFPPLLYAVVLIVGLVIHGIVPRHVLPALPARLAGGVLLVVSMSLAGWGRKTMVRGGTNIDPREPTLAIVTDGPFRYTRNPLYIAITGFYLGAALLVNTLWPLLLLIPLLVVVQKGIVEREERYLEAKFGDTYRAYRARVRRWF